MVDLLFLFSILIGVGVGTHMALKPQYHADQTRAKGGTGALADPKKVRVWGATMAVVGVTVFILRTFVF